MKRKFKIQQKIQIYILSSTILIFLISIGYIGLKSRSRMLSISRDLADSYAREYANLTSDKLNYYANAALNMQTVFENFDVFPHQQRRKILSEHLKNMLQENPRFLSVWSILEPDAIDTLANQYKNTVGSTVLGNFRYVYYRQGDEIVLSKYIEQNPDEVLSGTIYSKVRQRMKPTIVDPYYYTYSGNKSDEILETNIVAPVVIDSKFGGVVGIDVPLTTINQLINRYSPIEESFAFLLSNTGKIVSFPDQNAIGQNIEEIGFLNNNDSLHLAEKMENGESFAYYTRYEGERYYIAVAPVLITGTNTSWFVNIALPVDNIMAMANKTLHNTILVVLIGLLILVVVIYFLAKNITRPIKQITKVMENIAQGDVTKNMKLSLNTGDEIGDMALALNKYIDGYAQKTEFASQIGNGDLDQDLDLLSEDDKLGVSLMKMRDNLSKAREEENKRKEEDKKHRWANEGIAKFADILRKNNDDIKKLSFQLMKNLVDYLGVSQGALFVIEENEKENEVLYEVKSTIAFNRRQYNKTKVKVGEDLVGRCAHEKKTIHLREVPDNYIEIRSGMGTASPKAVLIVPAVLNEKVYAIIEMASFDTFEDYQIDFVEKIGESVASTIANVKVSEKTQALLKESQYQQEELSSQEEEMRQNLEELQTTQEEASRREFELRNLIEALSIANYMVEYDMHGIITDVNERFASLVGVSREQIIGMSHKDGLDFTQMEEKKYRQFWEDLRHGISRSEETRIEYNDRELYMYETYTPLMDKDDEPYKVVKIAVDITDLRLKEKELEEKSQKLEQTSKALQAIEKEKAHIQEELKKEREKSRALEQKVSELPDKQQTTKTEKSEQVEPIVVLPPAGEPLIEFTGDMENQVAELNEQHKRIVELVNQLYIGLRTDKPKKEIKETLKMLVDFSAWHFSNEERYFEEFEFENADVHTENHKKFLTQIDSFRKKYQTGRIKFYDDVMRFIKVWIETHFASDDKQYEELFKSKGL